MNFKIGDICICDPRDYLPYDSKGSLYLISDIKSDIVDPYYIGHILNFSGKDKYPYNTRDSDLLPSTPEGIEEVKKKIQEELKKKEEALNNLKEVLNRVYLDVHEFKDEKNYYKIIIHFAEVRTINKYNDPW